MNTFGRYIRLTTFGESHGPAMGGILDGMPSRVQIDTRLLQSELDRRAPGRLPNTSARKEPDSVEILSGISAEGLTLGTPIGFIIRNKDAKSEDYMDYEDKFRPNHADFTYVKKYGIHDFRGGGRASARETVNWVVGGAICRQWLETFGVKV
ncbi:MAG: chorismate synthase, partial [Muribaculaceae bacterium]|nr:chorismate synthase [Muribaculaceae bacterium]